MFQRLKKSQTLEMQAFIRLNNWNISLYAKQPERDIITPKQTHGSVIIPVAVCVPGVTVADGLIGTAGDTIFGIQTADCLPFIFTTVKRAFALHISRHTLTAGILDEVVKNLHDEHITGVYIGPHICEACFTFKEKGEGVQLFEQLYPYAVTTQKSGTSLSLLKVIVRFLEKHNVPHELIIQDGRCTYEDTRLPSYKRWIETKKEILHSRIITSIVYTV